MRLIHVSALGLRDTARSRFILSKLAGERAIASSASLYSIVRPSLVDGEAVSSALIRYGPLAAALQSCERYRPIAALDAHDLGEAIAVLCEMPAPNWRGGAGRQRTAHHERISAAMRPGTRRPATAVSVPSWIARLASHFCDVAHFSPFSFGHFELLQRETRHGTTCFLSRAVHRRRWARLLRHTRPESKPAFRQAVVDRQASRLAHAACKTRAPNAVSRRGPASAYASARRGGLI